MLSKIFTTVAIAASLVSAQTFTDCDPTKRRDCPNPKAVGSEILNIDFRQGPSDFFTLADGTSLKYDNELGAVVSVGKESDAPTISSKRYIFFGQVDIVMRASPGVGIVSSFVLQSDDLDEIDWEWLGGDNTQVQHNYFSKGCTENYNRGGFSGVHDPIGTFHTYTIRWTPEQLDWIIDGAVVRTLRNEGLSGCDGYPQAPMQIKLGNWVAGRKDAPQGTIDWAGGIADFSNGAHEGYYQTLRIQDFMGGRGAKEATEYQYTDLSGTWESIRVVNNGEDAEEDVATTTSKSKTSSTVKPSSSATTLTTVSTAVSSDVSATATTSGDASDVTDGPTGTTENQETGTSTGTLSISTAAAPTMMGNVAAAGAAALLGYLVL